MGKVQTVLSRQTIILSSGRTITRSVSGITGNSIYQQGDVFYNSVSLPVYRDTRDGLEWHEDAAKNTQEAYRDFLEDVSDDVEYGAYLDHIATPRAEDY